MSSQKQPDLKTTSDVAAFVALVCLIPIFLAVVTYGWGKILTPMLPISAPFDVILAYTVAIFLAVVGVVLAKIIALETINLSIDIRGWSLISSWILRCWAYLLVLVIISALGTTRTIFSISQAADVLRGELAATDGKLRDLQVMIDKTLKTIDFDARSEEFKAKRTKAQSLVKQFETEMNRVKDTELAKLSSERARVESLWSQFQAETSNPLNCGFGQEAEKRFGELNAALGGGLKRMSGQAGNNCNKWKEALEIYKTSVDSLKESYLSEAKYSCNISSVAAQRMSEIQSALADLKPLEATAIPCSNMSKIVSDYSKEANVLIEKIAVPESERPVAILDFKKKASAEIKTQLDSIEELVNLAKVDSDNTLPVLRKSWDVYRKNLSEAETLSGGKSLGLTKDIMREEVENIDNLTNILRILASRLDNFMTYLTIFAALLMDMILISFFGRHLSSRVQKKESGLYDEYSAGDNIFKS
jgi:hypothetical protein